MVLFQTQVTSTKPYEEVYGIIKESASRNAKSDFAEDSFSIICLQRASVGIVHEESHITGTLEKQSKTTVVKFCLHAGFRFWFGALFAVLGALNTIVFLWEKSPVWYIPAIIFLLGALICANHYWAGKGHIDRMIARIR